MAFNGVPGPTFVLDGLLFIRRILTGHGTFREIFNSA